MGTFRWQLRIPVDGAILLFGLDWNLAHLGRDRLSVWKLKNPLLLPADHLRLGVLLCSTYHRDSAIQKHLETDSCGASALFQLGR